MDASSRSSEQSNGSSETPKLVRQGSYILDNPSPMLLAHMQTELTTDSDYAPTPSSATKRKEWNINEAKTQWEKSRDCITPKPTKPRRNSISSAYGQRSIRQQRSITQQYARSADCIQTMLSKELVSRNNRTNSLKNCSNENPPNSVRSGKWRSNKNSSSNSPQNTKVIETKKNGGANYSSETDKENNVIKGPSKVVVSEKLISIFKEIQDTHEKQMADLMEKQKREQAVLQKEFEKQQLLLLTQIKSAFPKLLSLSEESTADNNANEHTTLIDLFTDLAVADLQSNGNQAMNNGVTSSPSSRSGQKNRNNEPKKFGGKLAIMQNYHDEQFAMSIQNYSKVNRQLFPLSSKTTHLPAIDNSAYTEKHVNFTI